MAKLKVAIFGLIGLFLGFMVAIFFILVLIFFIVVKILFMLFEKLN